MARLRFISSAAAAGVTASIFDIASAII